MRYVLILLLLFTGCKSTGHEVQEQARVPVRVCTPSLSDVPLYVDAIGTLRAHALVDVRARLSGVVTAVHAADGDWVEEGSLLFEIDDRPYVIQLEKAKAELAKAKATLDVTRSKMMRFQSLIDKKLISQNESDEIAASHTIAEADLQLAKARVKEAKLDLEHCKILAQKTGKLGVVDIHPGHLANVQETLAKIATLDPIGIEFSLTEDEFSKVKDAKKIHIELLSSHDASYDAMLIFYDNSFDPSSGLVLLRATLSNKDHSLLPGMGVKVQIPVGVKANALHIPQKAIKHNQFGAFVYVVDADDTVAIRQIEPSSEFGDDIVVEGLSEDARVIVEGHQRTFPGTQVDIRS